MNNRKMKGILLIAVFILSTLAIVTPLASATTPITIDGDISTGEWDGADIGTSSSGIYTVYVLNDADYLYVAFEATEGDFTIASSMTNTYIYAGDDWGGECWAYTAGAPGQVVGLTYFTTHHIPDPKVKEGQESRTTTAIVSVSPLMVEWKIPLSEFPMNPGDPIAFDFLSYSEGVSGWNDWIFEQEYSATVLNEDTGFYYTTIQAAIDAADTGDTVLVYPGTYLENPVINVEGLTLESTGEAEDTVIEGLLTMIHITASDVTLDGFTIDATDAPGGWIPGSVYITDGATGVTIKNNIIVYTGADPTESWGGVINSGPAGVTVDNNRISNFRLGVYLNPTTEPWIISNNIIEDSVHCGIGIGSAKSVEITGNTITDGNFGIEIFGSVVSMKGNVITGSEGPIWMTGDVAGTEIGSETGGADANTITGSGTYDIHALDATGPVDIWEDNVYDTLLIENSEHIYVHVLPGEAAEATVTGDGSVDAPDAGTTVAYTEAGECTITVENLDEDEVEEATFSAVGEYVDVKVDDPLAVTSITITVGYDDTGLSPEEEATLIMYWYDKTNWRPCSDTGVNTVDDNIWATIRDDTSPSLAQMKGTPFGPGEGLTLDSDFYKKVDEITVDAAHTDANKDPIRLETIDVDVISTIDTTGITVVLTETGANTGIFTGSFQITDLIPPPVGYLAVDEGNLVTVEHSGTFAYATIDETAPLFDEEDPIVGLDFYNNEDTITLTIGLDVAGYDVTADFSAIDSEYTAADETFTDDGLGVYTITYDLSEDNTMVDGLYIITVTAEDAAGNTATSDFTTTLDNTMPSVTEAEADPFVIQPEDPTLVTFTVSVSDDLSGVDTVTIDLLEIGGDEDQDMAEITETIEGKEVGTGVYTVAEASYTVALDGDYVLPITATDMLGNENVDEAITLRVIADLDAPIFVSADVTYPTDKVTARKDDVITVTVVVTDELSGVDTVSIDANEIGIVTPKPMTLDGDTWTATLTVGTLIPAETYELTVTATDYAGNTASTLAEVLIQELATMEMYTLSANYDPGDTVGFYVSASFAFDLDIEILDPTGFVYTTIHCIEEDHWMRVGDYSIVPYQATFDLPSTAVSSTWNWTASEAGEEVANGTFTVGEVVEPQPELPAETTGEETLDSTGAPKTSFALGETVQAYSDITNVGTESQTMLIVVQFKDPAYRVFAPVFLTITLAPEQSFGYAPGLIIPPTGYTTGTWTAKIMVFDAWPALGGVPIGLPVTLSFTVTS